MGSQTVTLRWASVVAWSERHFDVITATELAALGVPSTQVRSWVRTGRLHPLHRGAWAVGRAVPRPEGRWRAAVLGAGPVTLLSHQSAGQADGLAVPPATAVHVTTTSRSRSGNGRIVHCARAFHPDDVTTRWSIPTTSTARTLVDLADVLDYAELRRVFDGLRRLDPERLAAARDRAGQRRGARKLTHLLERDEPHTRSALERRYLRFAAAHGIRRPDAVNVLRHGYEIDCSYVAERVAVELDGRAFHTRGADVRADHHRDAELHLAGWVVHRITWEELNPFEAPATADRLAALLAMRDPQAVEATT